jgi:hypothetical protein
VSEGTADLCCRARFREVYRPLGGRGRCRAAGPQFPWDYHLHPSLIDRFLYF